MEQQYRHFLNRMRGCHFFRSICFFEVIEKVDNGRYRFRNQVCLQPRLYRLFLSWFYPFFNALALAVCAGILVV